MPSEAQARITPRDYFKGVKEADRHKGRRTRLFPFKHNECADFSEGSVHRTFPRIS